VPARGRVGERALGRPSRTAARTALVVSVVGFVGFALVTLLVATWPAFEERDQAVSEAIRERCAPTAGFFRAVTTTGNALPVAIVTTAVFAVLLAMKRRIEAIWFASTIGFGWLLSQVMQAIVSRARPSGVALIPLPDQPSYPSGHATTAGVLFGSLAILAVRHVESLVLRIAAVAAAAFMVLAVGISRVCLGVHFLADIVGGWLLAAGWLGLTTWAALEAESRTEAGE
jgi:undecaprenyl-diphosphatase